MMRPCSQAPDHERLYDEKSLQSSVCVGRYTKSKVHEGVALHNQPVTQLYCRRPLEVVLTTFFDQRFVLTGIRRPVSRMKAGERLLRFEWCEIPPVIVLRLLKQEADKRETKTNAAQER